MRRTTPVNLNLLHTFLVVADSDSFRRAAEQCFRSESAISMQIRQLEEQLGVTLFQRTTRRVRLTDEGRRLAEAVHRGMDEILSAIRETREAAERRMNQVTVGVAPSVAAALIPQILTAFRIDYPKVVVTVRQANLPGLTEMVRTGEVEFGVGSGDLGAKDLEFEPLIVDELLPVFPPGEAERHPNGITPEEFSKYPLILNEKAVMLRQQLDKALADRGVTVVARYQALEFNTTLALVSSGLGVGVVPKLALLGSETDSRPVPIIGLRMERHLGIIMLHGKTLPRTAGALLTCTRTVLKDHPLSIFRAERTADRTGGPSATTPEASARSEAPARPRRIVPPSRRQRSEDDG
jgi:DNA-binding transcriptional LysR family regulator